MNSYFSAINQATNNGTFPELSDCWRSFHPEAILSDSELQDPEFQQIQFLREQAWKSPVLSDEETKSETRGKSF